MFKKHVLIIIHHLFKNKVTNKKGHFFFVSKKTNSSIDGLDILSIDSILHEAPFKLTIYSVLIENKLKANYTIERFYFVMCHQIWRATMMFRNPF